MGTQRPDFAEFYGESRDACLFSVLVNVADRDVAQDLVDEAFARAWASWRSVSRHPAPSAWVVRAALNASISRWRRRREVSLPDPGAVADLAAGPGAADSTLDPRIMAALTRLPARQQQVVTLRLLLDPDTSRTAKVLGISPSAVKAHLARALQRPGGGLHTDEPLPRLAQDAKRTPAKKGTGRRRVLQGQHTTAQTQHIDIEHGSSRCKAPGMIARPGGRFCAEATSHTTWLSRPALVTCLRA
jgi:RNA polymerase sigma factor (sigma-70 family)